MNPYAFTRAHYFNSKLDDLPNSSDTQNDNLRNKLLTQFKLFDGEYTKISQEYNLKNRIDFSYVKKQLIYLNKHNPNFTKSDPIQFRSDPIRDEIIHESLLNGSILTLAALKIGEDELNTYLFAKTCIRLGWFIL